MKVDYSGMAENLKSDLKKAIGKNNRSELKRCPFCGGEAYLEIIPNLASNEYVVCCKNKECLGFYIGYGDVGLYGTREGAIKAWNTRKPLERVIKRLEEEGRFADKEKERCAIANPLQFDSAKGYSNGIYNAIEIIKQEMIDISFDTNNATQNSSETQHDATNYCNMEHIQKRFERVM